MQIKNANKYGKIDITRLTNFETSLHKELPKEYRDYLIKYNGGIPNKVFFCTPDKEALSSIHHFFGLNDGPEYQEIGYNVQTYSMRIPNGFLPIADDPFGNLICIGIDDKNYGLVFFWDHEKEYLCHDGSCILKLADSFNGFIEALIDTELCSDKNMTAIENNDIETIRKLIEANFDLNMIDSEGLTLIEYAAIHNKPEILQLLFDNGAKLGKSLECAKNNYEFFPEYEGIIKLIEKLSIKRDDNLQ